jgi:ATP-dependent DNA helicase RecQ
MASITFIDTEIDPKSRQILDIGGLKSDGNSFHKASVPAFIQFLKGSRFVCGHNIIHHDVKFIKKELTTAGIDLADIIDTLYLSPLLFPTKPYHALVKDDKLQTDELNNPLNDCLKAKDLFYDEVAAFKNTEAELQQIFYHLLHNKVAFRGFFRYLEYEPVPVDTALLIRQKFEGHLCRHANLEAIISRHPVELAYCLSLINSFVKHKNINSITPSWVLRNYPEVEQIMLRLRNQPCITGCTYCNIALDIHKGLNSFFGFDSYRTYGGEPLQERAVKAAVNNKSILAVFPTGGGKSITFQVPALISGAAVKGLTVVISPLQSLMKDQVDNLEKAGITEAVTINGLLDPIERAKAFERVEDGSATLLYIAPEALRSKTVERLLLGRKIVRFVIDEAHCFSAWGQDFRVDYLYIGDFIKALQAKKNLEESIPVSCFTATAKQKVIDDIRAYFKEKLSLDLELYTSKVSRTNLRYKVFEKDNEEEKYQTARALIESKKCPTIIYVSRTKKAYTLAERLIKDGFNARPYHGKMDKKEKSANQNAFISGETQIMVATSAFGMGVDKKDVGMVIHYEISDSLENYIQESGRAGRDEQIVADCYVLFNEEDLNKYFILLNQTKLSIKEIQQIWKAIKDITRFRSKVSNSALEIARKAGWDDNVVEIETRVTTAIAALEEAGYLKRGQNMPRIFANSILSKNAQEAIKKIRHSARFEEAQKEKAIRIIKKLFSSKSRKQYAEEVPETRIDYISDHLGIVKEEVINIVNLLREEKILADAKDLSAFINKSESKNRSLKVVELYSKIEKYLATVFEEEEKTYHLKTLNEAAELHGCEDVSPQKLKTIINFWAIKHLIKKQNVSFSKNQIAIVMLHPRAYIQQKLEQRHELAKFIIEYLYNKTNLNDTDNETGKEEVLVEFSEYELKEAYENRQTLFKLSIQISDIEDALFYLSRIDALKIEGGFLVIYNGLTIERIEQDNKKRYKLEDYQKLKQFYENKVQQIHIVGEYAKRMINDYRDALQFVEDYFQINYQSFLNKYFKGSRQNEIKRTITPAKFRQLFGELSATQLKIINDNESKYIVVAAGPGSGKTRVLVHKLASLLLMEDVKHEQMLMITFSRAAATEFKKRLLKLIGNAANFIEIKTFHSYCFDLLGKVGSLEKSGAVLKHTIERIKRREVEPSRITKTVLVIDEAQDMDADEFQLIYTLMGHNTDMRVIAVGDDDQNIYEFRGASSRYLESFISVNKATKYELVENYRSKRNLVDLANFFVKSITHRLKEIPIIAMQRDNGALKIIRYKSNHLVIPLVQDILATDLAGTTCVLVKTNEEALQITGLLLKHGLQASLIQTNDGFNLYNLWEVRFFLDQLNKGDDIFVIDDENWANAKRKLWNKFRNSSMVGFIIQIIKDFEATHTNKRYLSDLEVFIRESRLEDFLNEQGESIFVSTIHKAKGKEFDNVFLMLDQFNAATDEAKRQLYVAITRAKQNLTIHLNTPLFDNYFVENLEWIDDNALYEPPDEFIMQLTFRDIWLDYFAQRQHLVDQLISGQVLGIHEEDALSFNGQPVLKFSRQYLEEIASLKNKNYFLKSAKVNAIVYWLKEGSDKEIKIVLPELCFIRRREG